jgi:hypothetical protein
MIREYEKKELVNSKVQKAKFEPKRKKNTQTIHISYPTTPKVLSVLYGMVDDIEYEIYSGKELLGKSRSKRIDVQTIQKLGYTVVVKEISRKASVKKIAGVKVIIANTTDNKDSVVIIIKGFGAEGHITAAKNTDTVRYYMYKNTGEHGNLSPYAPTGACDNSGVDI